ncbi:MAG: extensin family protein, partial [Myxococcales bacterium]|nr:extensin family protein [Myxococcales bacterium]
GLVAEAGHATTTASATQTSASPKRKKAKKKRSRRSSIGKHTTRPADAEETPAVRYAQLSQIDCEIELDQRDIAYDRVYDKPEGVGVLAPVRLGGPLRGVTFRSDASEAKRETSPYEIADCRLVLALDDFAQILARHDIVEVRHYSMYRPPRSWPEGKIGKQHAGALALDAGRFLTSEGKVLDVDRDFHGAIGAKTCGEGARPRRATPESLTLRAILCEAVDARMFNVVLTPNYNRPHHNHFHLEVMAGVHWFLVH